MSSEAGNESAPAPSQGPQPRDDEINTEAPQNPAGIETNPAAVRPGAQDEVVSDYDTAAEYTRSSLSIGNQGPSHPQSNFDADQHPDAPLDNQTQANLSRSDSDVKYVPWIAPPDRQSILRGLFMTSLCLLLIAIFGVFVGGVPILLSAGSGVEAAPKTTRQYVLNMAFDYCVYLTIGLGTWGSIAILYALMKILKRSRKPLDKLGIIVNSLFLLCSLIISISIIGFQIFVSLKTNTEYLTVAAPRTTHRCSARVSPQQTPLFTTLQQSKMRATHGVFTEYIIREEDFHTIRRNTTLCGQGFDADKDLYGIGIRISMYLQWVSALLTNNLLPSSNKGFQNVYLLFSLAICIATLVSTLNQACVFATEIEVLYWMYWGGVLCVFVSSPSQTRLGQKKTWRVLSWVLLTVHISHMIMIAHAVCFTLILFQQTFARMPCGTYHFPLASILDPSRGFDNFKSISFPHTMVFGLGAILAFPGVVLVLQQEIMSSIRTSAVYDMLIMSTAQELDARAHLSEEAHGSEQFPKFAVRVIKNSLILSWRNLMVIPRSLQRSFRLLLGLSLEARPGIYLVTPLDVKKRWRYRIGLMVLGIASAVLAITAIECNLKWNKITGAYSIDSTGQWMALAIGILTFISVVWEILKQESNRRRRLRLIADDGDGVELESLQSRYYDAVEYAFAQPDEEFLTNGGVLPLSSTNADDDGLQGHSISPSRSELGSSSPPTAEYLMPGALRAASSTSSDTRRSTFST